MKHLPALLLLVVAIPALGEELRIDPLRLQEQVKQRSEQAAQQGAAPSPAADWIAAPAPTSQGLIGERTSSQRGHGYGQGFDRRYGQEGERSNAAPNIPADGGMGHGMGSGHSVSGRGGGQGHH